MKARRPRKDGFYVTGISHAHCARRWLQAPHRKRVTIILPEGLEYGLYTIGTATLTGLHSTQHTSIDGMGATVYAYVREARLMEPGEGREQAIDRAIKSGIMLSVPTSTGGRESIRADVVSVSGIFGD